MATVTETTGDAAASADTSYSMEPGDVFTGRLGERFDEDWVQIELQAGLTYEINLTGDGADGAADTILRIYNASGEQVAMNDDVDLAAGNRNSMVSFTPESSGTYYIGATSYTANPNQENWGDYRITVSNPGGIAPMDEDSDSDTETGQDADLSLDDFNLIVGTEAADILTGTQGDDALIGGPGDDELDAQDGNDVLVGGLGADILSGGAGNDTASYDEPDLSNSGVTVDLSSGEAHRGAAEGDTFPHLVSIEYLDEDGNIQQAMVPDIENLRGTEFHDILTGTHGPNRLEGLGSLDYLYGLAGNDVLLGGPGKMACLVVRAMIGCMAVMVSTRYLVKTVTMSLMVGLMMMNSPAVRAPTGYGAVPASTQHIIHHLRSELRCVYTMLSPEAVMRKVIDLSAWRVSNM